MLISAYACEPGKGSEPGVGWNFIQEIGRIHEVWAITRANNRAPIEEALRREPLPTVHWVYFDLPRWMRFWKKGGRGVHAYYYLWQLGAYFVARKLHGSVGFDLTHHVTFVNYWMPSFLALLPVPFLWGPVGGGESSPRRFLLSFSLRGVLYEVLRDGTSAFAHLDPFVRLTARSARVALATTPDTADRLRSLGCRNVSIFSQLALPPEEIRRLGAMPLRQSLPFRVASIGNLLHLKGFEFGLRAFARLHDQFPACEYWLIGAGPERNHLERLARKLGCANQLILWGNLPRDSVHEKLAKCDVLLCPSLHDSGGWACMEAMAAGRPVVCLELGGLALQVTPETGIRVPATSPEQVVRDLTAALVRLARHTALRTQMAQAGRRRVEEHFHRQKKGEKLATIYAELSVGAASAHASPLAAPQRAEHTASKAS